MIKQLLCASVIGIAALLYYVQKDAWCKKQIAVYICDQLEQSLGCSIAEYEIHDIAIINGTITFSNITICSLNVPEQWKLRADTFSLRISWVDLFLYGTLDLELIGAEISAYSVCHENHVALYDHICSCLSGMQWGIPVIIKEVFFKNITFVLSDVLGVDMV